MVAPLASAGSVGTRIDSDDPNALETAKRHHEEMKQLIAEKKYEFVTTFQSPDGPTQYVYSSNWSMAQHAV